MRFKRIETYRLRPRVTETERSLQRDRDRETYKDEQSESARG